MESGQVTPPAWKIPLFFLLISGLFLLFYFFHHSVVPFTFWDESIYVNAARSYLSSTKPFPNPEHPLLGKQILALGIRIFGDNPTGWRFFSIVSGAFSCTAVCYLVWLLTKRIGVMLFVAVLLFFDPLLYVHLRIGLLDPPLTAFLLLSAILACRFSLSPAPKPSTLVFLGLTLGLALSIKLLTLFIIPSALALVLYRLRKEPDGKRHSFLAVLLLLGLPALLLIGGYRFQGYTLRETFDLLVFNFSWHSTAKSWGPITSRWYEWFYIGNPLWYFKKPIGDGRLQVMLATGNLILWIGAEMLAIYAVIRKWRQPEVLFLVAVILAQFLVYARKPHTYIHYMTEILPFLYVLMGVGIADLFERCEARYRRVLQIDFALFGLISLVTFWNYWPFISGTSVTREQIQKVSREDIPELKPTPSPSPLKLK